MPEHDGWRPVKGHPKKWVLVVLSVLWIFAAHLGYYIVHKRLTTCIALASIWGKELRDLNR